MSQKKKTSPPLQLSRRALAGWLGLFLALGATLFILGVLVGRGTSPLRFDIAKLQKELLTLKNTQIQEDRRRFKIDSDTQISRTDMEFHEALKDVSGDDHTAAESPQPVPKKSAEKDSGPAAATAPPAATVAAPQPKVAAGQGTGKPKRFTLQVGAVRDGKEAVRMVVHLKKKGYAAFSSRAEVAGKGTWYRVRVGNFASRDAAERMLARLRRDQVEAVVVRVP
jgi:cell division protein FtsN